MMNIMHMGIMMKVHIFNVICNKRRMSASMDMLRFKGDLEAENKSGKSSS